MPETTDSEINGPESNEAESKKASRAKEILSILFSSKTE